MTKAATMQHITRGVTSVRNSISSLLYRTYEQRECNIIGMPIVISPIRAEEARHGPHSSFGGRNRSRRDR